LDTFLLWFARNFGEKTNKMKIIVTGSLGHISKPLTEELVQKGHSVTVISSKPGKASEIEAIGASAAIGSIEDVEFLSTAFKDADAVYLMVPPNNYFDQELDLIEYYRRIGKNYALAVEEAKVKRLVNLSTIGAELEKGSGILLGAHHVEKILNELLSEVSITHLRPTSFYYNLYSYVDSIKNHTLISANYGGEDIVPWVSPKDIAEVIAEEIETPLTGRKVRYVVSEELSCNETARILGEAIGKPDLKWMVISDEAMLNRLKSVGMNPEIAAGLVELYAGLHTGFLAGDYNQNRPKAMGKVKMKDFAKEFSAAFNR
jgi:uncharacterized protein YbjT (DUF2867 family)